MSRKKIMDLGIMDKVNGHRGGTGRRHGKMLKRIKSQETGKLWSFTQMRNLLTKSQPRCHYDTRGKHQGS